MPHWIWHCRCNREDKYHRSKRKKRLQLGPAPFWCPGIVDSWAPATWIAFSGHWKPMLFGRRKARHNISCRSLCLVLCSLLCECQMAMKSIPIGRKSLDFRSTSYFMRKAFKRAAFSGIFRWGFPLTQLQQSPARLRLSAPTQREPISTGFGRPPKAIRRARSASFPDQCSKGGGAGRVSSLKLIF